MISVKIVCLVRTACQKEGLGFCYPHHASKQKFILLDVAFKQKTDQPRYILLLHSFDIKPSTKIVTSTYPCTGQRSLFFPPLNFYIQVYIDR